MVCKCGKTIEEDEVWYNNTSNEMGEGYFKYGHDCNSCGASFESSEWGSLDDIQELFNDYDFYDMNPKPPTPEYSGPKIVGCFADSWIDYVPSYNNFVMI